MTTIFVNRSIPLSKVSRNAWANAGAIVLSRNPSKRMHQLAAHAEDAYVVVNLGITNFDANADVEYNEPDSVRSVLTPARLRKTMPNLIPPQPLKGQPFWDKGPGQGGNNKIFNEKLLSDDFIPLPGRDLQRHIEGSEYRVISVGRRVVQSHLKSNIEWTDGQHEADWEWAGVTAIKGTGIIGLVHKAVDLVPNGEHTVFGWDIILADKPYIIEANSSPGVNDATAGRIMKAIKDSL